MNASTILLRWYKTYGRNLPWRNTKDPYRILVSEIMLQQTQVDRVKPFYAAWLKRFPTWSALAKATNAEVITMWSGLGYNRRALMLRDIAKHVHEHSVPRTVEEWQSIKGIGPYTAAAVSAFAQHTRVMPIDTNIRRVLGRYLLGAHFPQPEDDSKIQENINTILPKQGNYFDVPQAIFDLATMVCTKKPNCATCPLRTTCKAADGFLSETVVIPKQMIKKPIESRHAEKPHPDRIYRGRILKLIQSSSTGTDPRKIGLQIDETFDPITDSEWLEHILSRMERDELIEKTRGRYHLKT